MTHHVVAIGDIHLKAGHSRNAARLAALDGIIAEGIALPGLGAWLLLGDLYDGRSSVMDRNDIAPRLQEMADRAPVVLIRGNHDAPGDLDVLSRLEARYPIRVFEEPAVVDVPLGTFCATLALAVLPYPSKGGLIAAGTTASDTLQAGAGRLVDVLRDLGATLEDRRVAGRLPIFIGHLNVGGSIASSGQPVIGREIEVAPADLALLGDVPKILGHIHAPQEIGGAYYAGSITANNWGEREAKRFLIVELDDATGTYLVQSRPIDTPPMIAVEGTLARDGFRILDGLDLPSSYAGAEVRVRYTFLSSERNVLDHEIVRTAFADALRLDIEPVAIPDRAVRAPEVAAAVTLEDKVRAWARLTDEDVSEGILAKLSWLAQGDATATLSAVANGIAELGGAQ